MPLWREIAGTSKYVRQRDQRLDIRTTRALRPAQHTFGSTLSVATEETGKLSCRSRRQERMDESARVHEYNTAAGPGMGRQPRKTPSTTKAIGGHRCR